ncbi:MAG: cysteine hydrolase [Thermoplasmatales archaeon]|nr:cysteine hydrolase [Thermoplasmatales archaeon]
MENKDFKDRKLALVLVDIQNKFAYQTEGLLNGMSSRLGKVNEAIDLFRETGNPVIFVFFDGDGHCTMKRVENPDELFGGLTMKDGDLKVNKTQMNSFRDSDLAKVIKECGCDGIVIAGLVAQYCVIATYFGAFDHDICPYMLKGGIAATDENNVTHVEAICKTVTVDEIKENVHFI